MESLQQCIIGRIQREGPITFADYMRMALYEPGYGYYVTGAAKMGWDGDYYTSTDVSNLFAHCVGRQLQQMWEQLDQPTPFVVLEQGAGRGHLAKGVRSWAELQSPKFALALDYCTADIHTGQNVVQSSLPIRAHGTQQVTPLKPHVLLSNELVDAFPVHIVEVHQAKLYELYIDVKDGQLCEVLDEPSSSEVAGYLDTYNIPWQSFPDGWRAEINLDVLQWIRHCAQMLGETTGFLFTIDYGDKAEALYCTDRRHGTLACYYQHQVTERPLARPGKQDITAHVNFSALLQEGQRLGLHLSSFLTQRAWLTQQGIYEELERIRAQDYTIIDQARASDQGQIALFQWYNLRQRAAALTDPYGMGNFKVLILRSKSL